MNEGNPLNKRDNVSRSMNILFVFICFHRVYFSSSVLEFKLIHIAKVKMYHLTSLCSLVTHRVRKRSKEKRSKRSSHKRGRKRAKRSRTDLSLENYTLFYKQNKGNKGSECPLV